MSIEINTVEGNKAIMLFDGWVIKTMQTFDPKHNNNSNSYKVYSKEGRNVRTEDIEFDIVYHQSWDALMPVVEKIENLHPFTNTLHATNTFEIDWTRTYPFKETSVRISFLKEYRGMDSTYHDIKITNPSKIAAVWQAVVQFINWYNNQSTLK